jgi:hypothetical protein
MIIFFAHNVRPDDLAIVFGQFFQPFPHRFIAGVRLEKDNFQLSSVLNCIRNDTFVNGGVLVAVSLWNLRPWLIAKSPVERSVSGQSRLG